MTTTPSRPALAKLGIHTATPVTKAFEFVRCGLKPIEQQVNSPGIRGTRARLGQRTRIVSRNVSGPIEMMPGVTEMDLLWPWLLGTSGSSPWSPGESLSTRYVVLDAIQKVFTFSGVVPARTTISGAKGQPLRVQIDAEGEDYSVGNAGTFPSLTIPTDGFFIFSDLTLTLGGSARKFSQFSLTIDHMVDTDRRFNSLTRLGMQGMDRDVSLSVGAPYIDDNVDLYAAGIAGAAGVLAIADGTTTYTLNFANVKIPLEGVEVSTKMEEIMLPLNCKCYSDGTDPEIKVTKS